MCATDEGRAPVLRREEAPSLSEEAPSLLKEAPTLSEEAPTLSEEPPSLSLNIELSKLYLDTIGILGCLV